MTTNLHFFYSQLSTREREFVDFCFQQIFRTGKNLGIPLNGSDPAERVVDAMAEWVILSRKLTDAPANENGKETLQ